MCSFGNANVGKVHVAPHKPVKMYLTNQLLPLATKWSETGYKQGFSGKVLITKCSGTTKEIDGLG